MAIENLMFWIFQKIWSKINLKIAINCNNIQGLKFVAIIRYRNQSIFVFQRIRSQTLINIFSEISERFRKCCEFFREKGEGFLFFKCFLEKFDEKRYNLWKCLNQSLIWLGFKASFDLITSLSVLNNPSNAWSDERNKNSFLTSFDE